MKPTGRSLDYELTSWIAALSASDRAADELTTHRTVPLPACAASRSICLRRTASRVASSLTSPRTRSAAAISSRRMIISPRSTFINRS